MKLRKILSVLVVLAMTLTMFGVVASAEVNEVTPEPQNRTINVTVAPGEWIPMEELLADLEFTFDDVSSLHHWDVRRTHPHRPLLLRIGNEGAWRFYTLSSTGDTGESQIHFDMECGSIVLVNVTVTLSTWQAIGNVLFEPIFWGIALFITGIGAPLGLLFLIASPVFWVSGFISLLRPTSYYKINPPLVFD